jgi:hypothetical protein
MYDRPVIHPVAVVQGEDVCGERGRIMLTIETCTQCGKVKKTVELGEPPQWDSATVDLCRDCLQEALDSFDVEDNIEPE